MSVIRVEKDFDNLSLILVAEFGARSSGSGSCGPTRGTWSCW